MSSPRKQVVIIGGGFGGLNAARSLEGANVDITVIDRENHHLFQPLLYQVATSGLSPGAIASPIRSVVGKQPNTRVVLGEALEAFMAVLDRYTLADMIKNRRDLAAFLPMLDDQVVRRRPMAS